MVNLLLTMRCNRACSYCFAREKMYSFLRSASNVDITIPDLDKVLCFLIKSGCDSFQLAGGEPTIHPKFDEMLVKILMKNFYVNLLSNGLWNSKENELFCKIPPTRLGFLINIDHPNTYNSNEWNRIEENLSALRGQGNTTLSFNIFEREPQCEYLFDLVSKYNINKLRLSFSMPVISTNVRNTYIPIEDYKELAPFIMDFVKKAESLNASVRMDNTVPICMFSNEELSELLLKEVLDPHRNFVCFPAIDIGPDLSVWRCFGTSRLYNVRLEEFNSLYDIYGYFEGAFRYHQYKVFPMDKCYECKYAKESLCQGGCIGFSIAACEKAKSCPEELSDEVILDMKPKMPKDMIIRNYDIPMKTTALVLRNWQILEISPLISTLLGLFNGNTTVREAISIQTINSIGKIEDPLDGFLASESSKEIISIVRRLLYREFLIP